MVVQNIGKEGRADFSFPVPRSEIKATLEAVDSVLDQVGAHRVTHDDEVSKVSVVGLNMASQTNVAAKMFRALSDAGVNIQMITTSEIKISTLVAKADASTALRAVHQHSNCTVVPMMRRPGGRSKQSETVTRTWMYLSVVCRMML